MVATNEFYRGQCGPSRSPTGTRTVNYFQHCVNRCPVVLRETGTQLISSSDDHTDEGSKISSEKSVDQRESVIPVVEFVDEP